MIRHKYGERHPLELNYLALYISIVKKYTPDQALILMGSGHRYNTSGETAVKVARHHSVPVPADEKQTATRRPPAWAELASRYS
jgi:hypothetical protein